MAKNTAKKNLLVNTENAVVTGAVTVAVAFTPLGLATGIGIVAGWVTKGVIQRIRGR